MQSGLDLKDIRLMMRVGHLEEERQTKQAMRLDITIRFDVPPHACKTDELQETICYDTLLSQVTSYCENNVFNLLEFLAQSLYVFIKSCCGDKDRILVRVTKLHPPIAVLHGGACCFYGDSFAC